MQSSFVDGVHGAAIDAYAGTMLLDPGLVSTIAKTDLAHFFEQWTDTLFHYPRFVVSWSVDSCTENCSSYFLPGGLDQVLVFPPDSIRSVPVKERLPANCEAMQVHRAPGIGLKFEFPGAVEFDLQKDCQLYGETEAWGLQLCGKQMGNSIAAGKTVTSDS